MGKKKFQKLAIEKQQVEEQSKHLDSDVKSLQESSNILRAAHERLFTDYKLVGEKCKKLEEENMKLKDENEDLNDLLNRVDDLLNSYSN